MQEYGFRAGKRPVVQQRIWSAMRFARTFSIEELASVLNLSLSTVNNYTWALLGAGYLRVVGRPNPAIAGTVTHYRLIRNLGPTAPKKQGRTHVVDPNTWEVFPIAAKETARDKAWGVMRELQEFTVEMLVDQVGIGRKNIQKYITGLAKAGYIVAIWQPRIEASGYGYGVYRVAEDAPKVAPTQKRDGSVDVPVMAGWLPGDAVLAMGSAVLPEQDYLPSDALLLPAPDIDQSLEIAQDIPEPVVDLDAIVEAPQRKPRKPKGDYGNRVRTELECQVVGWMKVNGSLAIQRFDEVGGGWNPGSIYRALRRLIKRGVVRLEGTHRQQVYHLLEG